MVRYLTGHAHLRRHKDIANTQQPVFMDLPQMKYTLEDPDENHIGDFKRQITCRVCKLKGREETPFHLAAECLGAWEPRLNLLRRYSFETEDVLPWEPQALLQIFKLFVLENKPNSL